MKKANDYVTEGTEFLNLVLEKFKELEENNELLLEADKELKEEFLAASTRLTDWMNWQEQDEVTEQDKDITEEE